MLRHAYVFPHSATPLGDIRRTGEGFEIVIMAGAEKRADWPRFLDAIAAAVGRGADVRWRR